ncbi:MAG: MFS transporter [Candidatus Atribacteria bacterium]|nr:MAG: MFS transporter [Candidatus Atribacteria bacterium]
MKALFRQNKHLLFFILVANLLHTFGHSVWRALFNNLAVEEIGVGADAIGWIQSVRELPGLLAFAVAFLALIFREMRIMAVSLVLLGIGIFLTGQSTTITVLFVSTFVMSLGFHYFNPGNNGLILMSVEPEETPKVIGQLRSVGAVAAVLGTGAVYLFVDRLGYETILTAVGALVIVGGAVLFVVGKGGHGLPSRRRVRLRKRYWLFYTLTFLMGSRRHIFTTFAPFLLVQAYGVDAKMMALLLLVNSFANVYVLQKIGKLVAKFGERAVLTFAFAALIPIFLGYAYVSVLAVLLALFVVDNVLFGFNLAMQTYMQKISVSTDELTANMSLQETINHISAVILPVVGGTIWVLFGSQAPFLIGVGVAVVSLVLVQLIRTGKAADPEGLLADGG